MIAQRTGYTALQIGLHWTIAALIVTQFLLHDAMEDVFDDMVDGDRVRGDEIFGAWFHAGIGATILVLAIVHLIVRLRVGAPPVHRDKPIALVWIASATHFALYAFIFAMPIVGAIAFFGVVEEAGALHSAASTALLVLVGLHVLGAIAEHVVFRNDTLMRMLRPVR